MTIFTEMRAKKRKEEGKFARRNRVKHMNINNNT